MKPTNASCIVGFRVDSSFVWKKWTTLPIFLGQLISAYEGIGCVSKLCGSLVKNSIIQSNRKILFRQNYPETEVLSLSAVEKAM